jgi:hypothetical protein
VMRVIHKGSNGHATKHLRDKHGIMSEKTVSMTTNTTPLDEMVGDAKGGYGDNPTRCRRLTLATWAAQHGIAIILSSLMHGICLQLPFQIKPKHLTSRPFAFQSYKLNSPFLSKDGLSVF